MILTEFVACLALAAFLLHHYGDLWRQNRLSTIAIFLTWSFSFLMIFLLPVDIASTLYRQCLAEFNNITTTTKLIPTIVSTTSIPMTTTSAIPSHSTVPSTSAGTTTNRNTESPTFLNLVSPPSLPMDLMFPADNGSAAGPNQTCVQPSIFVRDNVLQVVFWSFIHLTCRLYPFDM